MSIRISLDEPPEFYTNLDFIQGRVFLFLNRAEHIGNIVVKLEGESRTVLPVMQRPDYRSPEYTINSGDLAGETHKLLYLVEQIYPDRRSGASVGPGGVPGMMQPGQHEFRFRFKVPLNNICGNPNAMAALNGIGGVSGPGAAGFLGAFRTMDGSKQLMLRHVTTTLPPSLTGFPRKAEIRYYIKVTIQRPGFFKENWRYQIGFKFLPLEPPRPAITGKEAFARRPFIFQPSTSVPGKKKSSLFGSKNTGPPPPEPIPPSIEMSARLPYPSILTCNQPIPLRLVAKKLAPSQERVYLTSIEIALVGFTLLRVEATQQTEVTRWVVCSATNLAIPVGEPGDAVDVETTLPDAMWSNCRLPNTVAPSFAGCNISRRYEVELRVGLSWGLPSGGQKSHQPQVLFLPLKLSRVEVYSGVKPPKELVQSLNNNNSSNNNSARPQGQNPPPLPPRTPSMPATNAQQQQPPAQDPLYPPQLGPDNAPGYDDAPPPSYDEAMAQGLSGPAERPAYSGVTAENDPSTLPPEKSGLH